MKNRRSRINKESNTVATMIRLYCHQNHDRDRLCLECKKLLDSSRKRLDRCPLQEGKTTYKKRPVHCFMPEMREMIRAVMRYSDPRMIYIHPIMAIEHRIDGRRQKPVSRKDKKH